jgi:hypothetical protein
MALGLVVLGVSVVHAPMAQAEPSRTDDAGSKAICLEAHEQAQETRRESRFSETRKLLRICAQEACPGLVRADCVPWLTELDRTYPKVVFDAYVDGRQEQAAHAYIDGRLAADHIDGKPIELDPGQHVLRLEVAGFAPNEQTVVILEGSNPRMISASFVHPKPSEKDPRYRPIPISVWVVGGVAVAALVSLTVFGSLAVAQKTSLEGSCSPLCTNRQLGSLELEMHVADASLGLAAAAAIADGFLFLLRPQVESRSNAPSLAIAPIAGGGMISVGSTL